MKIKTFIKRKPWVAILAAVLVTVLACGAIASYTDTDLAFFEKDLNEDNLLFDTYNDLDEKPDASGITYSNRKGVITINGKISDSEGASDSTLSLTKVVVPAGTYTYTCFDKPTTNTYYSYLKYTESGTEKVVFADFASNNITMAGVSVEPSNTFTLSAATEVEVIIVAKAGNNFIGVKAYPTLVSGNTAGEFYAENK